MRKLANKEAERQIQAKQNQIEVERVKQETELAEMKAVTQAKIQAAAKTAGKIAESEADKVAAENILAAAKTTAEAKNIEAEGESRFAEAKAFGARAVGLAEAEVSLAKERAKYAGLSEAQILQVKLAETQRDSMQRFMNLFTQSFTANPQMMVNPQVISMLSQLSCPQPLVAPVCYQQATSEPPPQASIASSTGERQHQSG